MENLIRVNAEVYASRFGEGNVLDAFLSRHFGIMLKLDSPVLKQEVLISLEQGEELIKHIRACIDAVGATQQKR